MLNPVERANRRDLPSIEYLRHLFDYDPETGVVTRRVKKPRCTRGSVGDPVGTINSDGALIARIDYKIYYVHRLAWALYFGEHPTLVIDHVNGNPADNRLCNLRLATLGQNRANSRRPAKSQGYRGVHYAKANGKWKAAFGRHYLGYFDTPEAAAAAYRKAALAKHSGFARLD